VVAHGLVEIHRVQNRCIVPSEEFLCNDKNLGKLARLGEVLADLLLLCLTNVVRFELRRVVIIASIDNFGVL
jgi:hypothetical protein